MKKPLFNFNLLTACISLGIASQAWAGHTYSGINYQNYRDFAENKGKFTVGAQNIDIYHKNGNLIGTVLTKAPMIDFSVVSTNGVAALVGDQYIVSVAHNGGYRDVEFGAEGRNPDQHRYSYQIVKRNNYKPGQYDGDYHMPRLHKFVTEAEPVEMTEYMNGHKYEDLEKYPDRVRIGSGKQWQRTDEQQRNGSNSSWLQDAYHWRIAGNTHVQNGTGNGTVNLGGDLTKPNHYGALPIAGSFGDSGSPMFIYDAEKQKWLINGVLQTGNPFLGAGNGFQLVRKDWFYDHVFGNDTKTSFFDRKSNGHYSFTSNGNGTGTVTQIGQPTPRSTTVKLFNPELNEDGREEVYAAGGVNAYKPRAEHGENLSFIDQGKGELTLTNSINQGAGGLYFEGNFDVTTANANDTWQGAGISISEDSTVSWKVKNPEGDRLSKIGLGTLLVNGKGKNLGNISVGNGTVILDQQADESGQKQAFNEVGITSGRATVKLNSADQVDPNKIYFGFKGGRLDLNGNDLTFTRIQNVDEGAMLVNHNADKESTINVTGVGSWLVNNKVNDLTNKTNIAFNGWLGEKDDARNTGRLNLHYSPANPDNHFLLSGGTNLKGDVIQNGGNLVFSGRPTPHAYNHLNQAQSQAEGLTPGEVVFDNDWINRTFSAENFTIKSGKAIVSRNVSSMKGNWTIFNGSAIFGVIPNQENTICTRSDWTGATTCQPINLSDEKTIQSLPRTQIDGNVSLQSNARLDANGLVSINGNVDVGALASYRLTHKANQKGDVSYHGGSTGVIDDATLTGNIFANGSSVVNIANHSSITGNISTNGTSVINVDQSTINGDLSLDSLSQINVNNQSNIKGNISLRSISELRFNNSSFNHQITGKNSTHVTLSKSQWTMPTSTTLGNLTLEDGEVTLNPNFNAQDLQDRFNTLTINGNLNGNGTFNYLTRLDQYLGDKLQINGRAQGTFKLNVRNTGAEPTSLNKLTLVSLRSMPTTGLDVSLTNQYVDAGTWRYELIKDGNQYRLYSPMKETELKRAEAERIEAEKRKAQEEHDRIEAEKRKAQEEHDRIEAEKRKAQEEQERIEAEKRKAQEEQERIEAEKRKAQEEQERIEAEKRKAQEEQERIEAEKRKAQEEQERIEAEKRKAQEEHDRIEAEKRKAQEEHDRIEAERIKQLKQKELISRYSNTALSEFSSIVNNMLSVQDELDRILTIPLQDNVWTGLTQDQKRFNSDAFRSYQQKTTLKQIGVQKTLDHVRLGAVFSHNHSSNTFDEQVDNKAQLTMLSGFVQYRLGDLQVGLNTGFGLSSSKLVGTQSQKLHRKVFNYGVNANYQINLGELGIKPFAGANRYFIEDAHYQLDGANVQTPNLAFNRYNAGVRVDYTLYPMPDIALKPYVMINYIDASDASTQSLVNDNALVQPFGRYWQKEVGMNAEISRIQLTFFASQYQGSQLSKQKEIGFKLGYAW